MTYHTHQGEQVHEHCGSGKQAHGQTRSHQGEPGATCSHDVREPQGMHWKYGRWCELGNAWPVACDTAHLSMLAPYPSLVLPTFLLALLWPPFQAIKSPYAGEPVKNLK